MLFLTHLPASVRADSAAPQGTNDQVADDGSDVAGNGESLLQNAPGIFITGPGIDDEFIRQEVTFVNHVRDRKQADVHVLISRRHTAAGGREYTMEFIGQQTYSALNDTLTYVCLESDTEDERRTEMVRRLKLGLVRYLARTPLAEHLSVSFTQPTEPAEIVDAWNNWWFTIRGNCWLNGEKSYRSVSAWGSISAQRVTEATKFHLSTHGNYNESRYDYDDYKALSLSRSKGASSSLYFSVNDRWSAGASTGVYSSRYSNLDYRLSLSPALEYNLFPYDESTRRRLTFTYEVGARYYEYDEETIYGETSETLYSESLRVTLELIQPWGEIETSVTGSHYLHDLEKNRLRIHTSLDWRIFQGLSLNLSGTFSRIHDQLSLRKGEATEEEILLRQQELQTDYDYWSSVGIRYSFGSRYNNIVNPRFDY